jgi:flagellar protein FliO/FliZ
MKKLHLLTAMPLGLLSFSLWATPMTNTSALDSSYMLRVFGGLILVILLIIMLSWLVKKVNGVHLGSAKGFQLISSLTLGPKERVVVIKYNTRYFLLGVGSASVNLLHDFGDQPPEEAAPVNKSSFGDILKSAVGKS